MSAEWPNWPRLVAAAMVVVGAFGVISMWWMFPYLAGSNEQITVTRCGTHQEIYVEVAERPDETWCRVGPSPENGPAFEAFGIAHSASPQTVTAVINRGENPAWGPDDTMYAPTTDDVFLFAASAGLVLSGLGWLGAQRILGRMHEGRTKGAGPTRQV